MKNLGSGAAFLGVLGAKYRQDSFETDLELGPLLLRLSSRDDSRGFYLYAGGPVAIGLHWWKRWNARSGRNSRLPGFCFQFSPLLWLANRWAVRVNGKGRGWTRLESLICTVLGANFALGFRARGGIPGRPHGPWPLVRVVLTSNQNRIPYGFA